MLTIFTIVLNGMPYIKRHMDEFTKLKIPWQWRIVEGVSLPLNCTRWCNEITYKWHKNYLSIDGTHEYLNNISGGNVSVYWQAKPFAGKIEMIKEALQGVNHGVVMEVDADEIWTAEKLDAVYGLLKEGDYGKAAQFHCNYYVGSNKKIVSREGYGSNWYEWFRAWKWGPNVEFISHEPPKLNVSAPFVPRGVTEAMGLVFDHYAYATKEQAQFKEDFYGYKGLVDGWEALQKTSGPVRLNKYFSHVQDRTIVDDLF